MIIGFQDRFEPFVTDGSKRHTIRAGNRWKAGIRADLFVRPRQKDMRLLFRAPVVRVEEIRIDEYEAVQCGRGSIPPLNGNHVLKACRGPRGESLLVRIDGELLAWDETSALFFRDGFREPGECPQFQALQFWHKRLPFRGQIIHWDYDRRNTNGTST